MKTASCPPVLPIRVQNILHRILSLGDGQSKGLNQKEKQTDMTQSQVDSGALPSSPLLRSTQALPNWERVVLELKEMGETQRNTRVMEVTGLIL